MLLDYTQHVGIQEFVPTDTYERFQKNLKIMPDSWIWRNTPITYTCNAQGYRCPEWNNIDWSQSILVFGCSFTFGIGIDDKMTFPYLLQERTGISTINLGAVAASPMVQWANSSLLVKEKIKPRAVIYNWPPPNRSTRFLGKGKVNCRGPNNANSFCQDWIMDDNQSIEYLRYAIYSTNAMWECPVLHYHIFKSVVDSIPELTWLESIDLGRDFEDGGAHPGPESNKSWADTIFNNLRNIL
jgi:hypothetical protein